MVKRFDANKLFERWKVRRGPKSVYTSDAAEADAVAAGSKGMAMYSTAVGSLAPAGFDLTYWLEQAMQRELVLTLRVNKVPKWPFDQQPVTVYVSRAEELWRVPAHIALRETAFVNDGRWSDSAEDLHSHLLGYTPAQRKQWLKQRHQDGPAWTCATIYVLLTKVQRKLVESVGRRCLGPDDQLEGMTLLWHRGGVLKQNVLPQLGRDQTLARFGLRWDTFFEIFGKFETMPKYGLHARPLTTELASNINAEMLSNVQFLTKSGWR